jgi:hypothetical protein
MSSSEFENPPLLSESLVQASLIIFQSLALYWDDLGFRTLLNQPVDYLTKKLLDHPNQRLIIGREDKVEMIAQSRADDVDWYLLFPPRKFWNTVGHSLSSQIALVATGELAQVTGEDISTNGASSPAKFIYLFVLTTMVRGSSLVVGWMFVAVADDFRFLPAKEKSIQSG